MKKTKYIIAGLVALFVLALIFQSLKRTEIAPAPNPTLEGYVLSELPEISPEKPVLGGKFYITKFEAHGGAGTVSYEDGHVAFIADFTYSVDEKGKPSIDSFTIRK